MDEDRYCLKKVHFSLEKIISFYEAMVHNIINRRPVGDFLQTYRLAQLTDFEAELCEILVNKYEGDYAGKLEDTIVYTKDNISFREFVMDRFHRKETQKPRDIIIMN